MKILILLIGHNNLSNYSLVKFLKKQGYQFDNIWLVHTNDTNSGKENLKKLLSDNLVEINVEELKDDYLKVADILSKKLSESEIEIEEIFLDYTGGLKSMSLGAFVAVNNLNLEEEKKYISYVFFDRQENKSKVLFKRGNIYDLNEPLSIREIATVHGIFDLEYKEKNSEFFSVENVLWLLEKVKKEETEFFEGIWDKEFKSLKEADWKKSIENSPLETFKDSSNKKLKYLQRYIRGDFLEEYIFYLLNEIKEECGIKEIAWNVKKGKGGDFEVDVIASKNNNLYLFSCTTDKTKGKAKSKGFEAKEKATQIGGKNANTILVSCVDENQKDNLLKDLEEKKGGSIPKIITYQDLINTESLKSKLKSFFN